MENRKYEFNVVISESVARTLWPEEDPIGKQALLWSEQNTLGNVIGVVGDMRERGLERAPRNAVYISYAIGLWNPVTFVLHTSGDPTNIMPTVRSHLAEVDADLPISNIRAFDDLVTSSMATRRFNTLLLLAFAAVALVMASAGIYGVMAYSVTERYGEIAIRVTLGARPREIFQLIVWRGMKRALLGAVIGLAAAVGLSQVMRSILFGVVPLDAVTYGFVFVILVATAFLSNYMPAVRAMRVDPVSSMRQE
jgi:putative ABC transport system permease protein